MSAALLAALQLIHGDDKWMALIYFWSAVLMALTPVIIFGGIAAWIARKYLRERKLREEERGAGR
jgi:hypothetical protein